MEARISSGLIFCAYCCHPGISHQWISVETMGSYDFMDISTGCNISRCQCHGFKSDIEQKRLI